MALSPGTRLGPYQVTAQIGEGGMGAVYRATDTGLDRQVAIKVLPDALAQDAERLARFEREAKTLAALNHPHIATIFGFERSSGTQALVMELVEGDDLSQRIARGALPLDDALSIARQIAAALEAAHEQGIVHRDLKPANIKVRADGSVKVLDFGLAKAMDTAAADGATADGATAAITSPAMTGVGTILGTAAYMAPEQAKGRPFRVSGQTGQPSFGEGKWQVSKDHGNWPQWRIDREIAFNNAPGGAAAFTAPVNSTRTAFDSGLPERLPFPASRGVVTTPQSTLDGQRFLIQVPVDQPAPQRSMSFVLNWPALLK